MLLAISCNAKQVTSASDVEGECGGAITSPEMLGRITFLCGYVKDIVFPESFP